MNTICAQVSETHRTIKSFQVESYGDTVQEFYIPKVHLQCAPNQRISAITFASFGTPVGTCGSFEKGDCHASTSSAVLEKVQIYLLLFHVGSSRLVKVIIDIHTFCPAEGLTSCNLLIKTFDKGMVYRHPTFSS